MKHLARHLIYAALIVLIVYLAATGTANAGSWPALDRIATQVTGQPVDVECSTTDKSTMDWMPNHVWGITYPGSPATVIVSQLVCGGLLYALIDPADKLKWQLYTYKTPGYGTTNTIVEGYALHVFTHELRHVTVGYSLFTWAPDAYQRDLARTERDAECYATAHDTEMALRFGLTPKRAAQTHLFGSWLHDQLPPIYQDGPCP